MPKFSGKSAIHLTVTLAVLGVFVLAVVPGCSDESATPASPPRETPTRKVVNMKDNYCEPKNVVIARGDTVVWFNAGDNRHTTTSGVNGVPDGLWDSGSGDPIAWLRPGQSFQRIFDDTTGVFPYFCEPHWSAYNETGTVTVNP
ncbi:MAG: hypothetical protein JSW58_02045 [Candidatus Latescibacterota bacterium]|nr:MAG: hypothetical protein JSW58_02045 [Candidatus Latescibacterota bacterium]